MSSSELPAARGPGALIYVQPQTMGCAAKQKPIAVTVKLDAARYEVLKALGARTRKSNQAILVEALDCYLR